LSTQNVVGYRKDTFMAKWWGKDVRKALLEYFGFWSEEDGELPPLPTKNQPPDPVLTALSQVWIDIVAASIITRLVVFIVWGVA
jgi:hypothetical protein